MNQQAAENKPLDGNHKIQFPVPSGPYPVGVLDFELTDADREELFAPGEARRIPARAWYPAASVSGTPRPYAKTKEFEHQVTPFCIDVLRFEQHVPEAFNVATHAYENAPIADIGKCPTLVFSHGGFSFLQQNNALMEHLASHGYLVVSISHPYMSYGSIYADGTVAPFAHQVQEEMTLSVANQPENMEGYSAPDINHRYYCRTWICENSAFAIHFKEWESDALYALEKLATGDLPESAQSLLPLIDGDRLGTFGMSMGCSATVAAHLDHRVKATVNLDGGLFDSVLINEDVRVPTLVMHGDPESVLPGSTIFHCSEFSYEKLYTMGTREDVLRFDVKGANHIAFSDFALIPESVRDSSAVAEAHLGTIQGDTMIHLMNDFVKAFFDKYLSGQGNGIDDKLRSTYPQVVGVDLNYVSDWAKGASL